MPNGRDEIIEADRLVRELVRHEGALVPQVRSAMSAIQVEGASEWRSRYRLARALEPSCRVRRDRVHHARALLAICLLRTYEGWPDETPLPCGERGRVSTVLMGVWGRSKSLGEEFYQFAWDIAEDSMRSEDEIVADIERLAQTLSPR